MTIRAQSADGKVHEFPDGTADAVVDRVMKDYARSSAKPAKSGFVSDIVGTMAGSVKNVRDKYDASSQEGTARARKIAERSKQVGFLRAATEDALTPVKNKGPGLGDLAAVPLSPIAGVQHALLRPVAETITKTIGPGYKSAGIVDQAKSLIGGKGFIRDRRATVDESNQRWESEIGNALAAAMPARAGVIRAATAAPKVNALAQTVAEFDAAGVRPTMAAVKGGASAKIANAVSENALAGARARGALRGTVDEVAASAGRTASRFGQPASRGAAGDAVQDGIQGFNQRFSERARRVYDDAFSPIERGEAQALAKGSGRPVVKPTATAQTIDSIWGGVNSPALRAMITDPRIAKIGDALATDASALRFGDLRAARTWVREAQKDDALRAGMSQGNLSRLESALTQDIAANAEALAGPQAARRLRQADRFYALGSQRISKQLQSFVGKGAPKSGEATYDLILRAASDKGGADLARLTALKKSLPAHEWGDVAASTIQRMAGGADDGFSINKFVTSLEGLSPGGKAALFGNGELRAELENLQRVATRVKAVEKGANASNSGTAVQNVGTIAGLMNPATFLPTAKVLLGMAGSAEIVTNPAAVRFLVRMTTAKSPAALAATVGQLKLASQKNRMLLPLYQQTVLLLEAPKSAISATAEETSTTD